MKALWQLRHSICAGSEEQGINTNDSGGPLFVRGSSADKDMLVSGWIPLGPATQPGTALQSKQCNALHALKLHASQPANWRFLHACVVRPTAAPTLQVGITSFNSPADGFVNVAAYRGWIDRGLKILLNQTVLTPADRELYDINAGRSGCCVAP